jgi:peptide/histidine transporter 3/4
MGSHFEIPAGSLTSFIAMSMVVSIVVYDRILVRIFQKIHRQSQRHNNATEDGYWHGHQRLNHGSGLHTDMKRISVVKARGLEGNEKAVAPLTVFILLPQFLLGGVAEALLEGGKLEFFYDQAPESMQSIGTALFASTLGIGSFLTSFLLNVSSNVSGRKGHLSLMFLFGTVGKFIV